MDTLSHGLYGGVAFGRKHKVSYWKAFFFGVMPDLFSFGILFAFSILNLVSGPDWEAGPPDPASIPSYIHVMYDITHSLVVAGVVIALVWWVRKKPLVELFAWPLHILVDIPTHSQAFFPTPFLWPVSSYTFDGISWSTPWVLILNLVILIGLYVHLYVRKRMQGS